MLPTVTEEESLFSAESAAEEADLPTAKGHSSSGLATAKLWCFMQTIEVDSEEDAAALQYVNFGGWRMGDLDLRRRWDLAAPLDVFLVHLKTETQDSSESYTMWTKHWGKKSMLVILMLQMSCEVMIKYLNLVPFYIYEYWYVP